MRERLVADSSGPFPARLPAAEWTKRADLAILVGALGAENVRWVGGAVRDTLLGLPVADVDAATTLPPDEVLRRLGAAKIKAVPTGLAHGTVTAVLEGGHVEITTLRRDVATDGRRATVAFASDWREDAARRDFTINALYAQPLSLELHDYFGGLADLEARRVRFIGDARQRIREDHLRILRYYRFQARFGGGPEAKALDEEAEDACAELAPLLEGLSRERVSTELLNLLSLPDPCPTIQRMFARGVLPVVLTEAGRTEIAALERLVAQERAQKVPPHPIRRLAALLPAQPEMAEQVADRLRLSVAQKGRLVSAAERGGPQSSPRALAYLIGREQAVDRLLLTGSDTSPLEGWDMPSFPLKGGEIVQRGVPAGPEITRIMRKVEARWLEEGFPPRSRVEQLLEEELR